MNSLIRVTVVALGILVAGWYYTNQAVRLSWIDDSVAWVTDQIARQLLSRKDHNQQLIQAIEKSLGDKFSSEKIRVLPLGAPQIAYWDDSDRGALQLYLYADSIPDWSAATAETPVYRASSYKVSEAYSLFLLSLDPANRSSSEWDGYRKLQRLALNELGSALSQESSAFNQSRTSHAGQVRKSVGGRGTRPTPTKVTLALDALANDGNWTEIKRRLPSGEIKSETVPIYSTPDDLAKWRSDSVQELTLISQQADDSIKISDTVSVDGAQKALSTLSGQVQVNVSRIHVFEILPGKWFQREVLTAYKNGPFIDGTPLFARSKFFGTSGVLSMMPRAVVVAQRPQVKLTLTKDDYQNLVDRVKTGARVSIGAMNFTAKDLVAIDAAARVISFSGSDNSAYIVAVVAEVLP